MITKPVHDSYVKWLINDFGPEFARVYKAFPSEINFTRNSLYFLELAHKGESDGN
jgi:hypothetical protein